MNKMVILFISILLSSLLISCCPSSGCPVNSTPPPQSTPKEVTEIPKGCIQDWESEEYDCGFGVTGLGLCTHSIDFLICSQVTANTKDVELFMQKHGTELDLDDEVRWTSDYIDNLAPEEIDEMVREYSTRLGFTDFPGEDRLSEAEHLGNAIEN